LPDAFWTSVLALDDPEGLDRFRADPRRQAAAPLLERSAASTELIAVREV
jgi:hypothetical protein